MTTPPPLDPATPPARTYGDDDVNRIVAKERRDAEKRAKDARDTELAEQWGIPIDQVPATLEAAKKAADKDKSDAQLAREAAETERQAATREKTDAATLRHSVNVERALIRAGLPVDGDEADEILADAVALVRVEVGADAAAIKDAVEKVKGRHAGMFTAATSARPPTHTPPDARPPSSRPSPPSSGRDPQVAQQLARRGINVDQPKAS